MKLKIKNIGPITETNIELSNTTIISGSNDSGKSTIGKVLYSSLVQNNKSDKFVLINEFIKWLERSDLNTKKEIVDYFKIEDDNDFSDTEIYIREFFYNSKEEEQLFKMIVHFAINNMKLFFEKLFENYFDISRHEVFRLKYLYRITIDDNFRKLNTIADNLDVQYSGKYKKNEMEDTQISIVSEDELLKIEFIDNSDNLIYNNNLFSNVIYLEPQKNQSLGVLDYKSVLAEIKIPYSSQAVDNNRPLRRNVQNIQTYKNEIKAILKRFNDIGIGEVEKGNYKTSNGYEIPIPSVASGIKCFLLIKHLLINGNITPSTLLIIDEPEISLHPNWQFEYVKLISYIKEQFGLNIILITHSNYIIETANKVFNDAKFLSAERNGNNIDYIDCSSNLNYIYNKLGSVYGRIDNL